tara:strand:- start:242 stop:628 length:387 start_codon:yes stop_codon:yes gene_type:complete
MSMEDFVKTLSDEQKQALVQALSGEVKEQVNQPEPTETVEEDFTMKKTRSSLKTDSRRQAIKAKKNTWTDNRAEHTDIETPKITKTPRNRKPVQKKEVQCKSCGKSFKVHPSVLFGEFYRCDRCAGAV